MTDQSEYTRTDRINEVMFPAFGPGDPALHAAEVVDSQGHIYLWVVEPAARVEAHGNYQSSWDDAEFRDAVYEGMKREFGPESEAPQDETFTIVFDPGRDQAEEWEIEWP